MKPAPHEVQILGKTYAIKWEDTEAIDENNYGKVSSERCEIRLALRVDLQQRRDCLLHEILHAIWTEMGVPDTFPEGESVEERIVRSLATGLLATLRDNPSVVRYLLSA